MFVKCMWCVAVVLSPSLLAGECADVVHSLLDRLGKGRVPAQFWTMHAFTHFERTRLIAGLVRAQKEAAKSQLPQKVEVVEIPQDDCWFRDSGCTVRDPQPPSLAPEGTRAVSQ